MSPLLSRPGAVAAEGVDAGVAAHYGDPFREQVALGPIIDANQRDRVHGLVTSSVEAGATVRTGGTYEGLFYRPTVLGDVPVEAPAYGEEIFGPVAPVVVVDGEEAAIAAANDTPYGLVSYLYSGDLARALRVGERLEAGMVAVNRGLVSDPAAPFGGVKQSGLGREGSTEGLLEYTETTYLAASW